MTDYSGLQCSGSRHSRCQYVLHVINWIQIRIGENCLYLKVTSHMWFIISLVLLSPLGFHKAVDRSCSYMRECYFRIVFKKFSFLLSTNIPSMKIDFISLEKSTSLFLLNVICLDSEMPYLRQSYASVYLYKTTVNTRGLSKFLIYEDLCFLKMTLFTLKS